MKSLVKSLVALILAASAWPSLADVAVLPPGASPRVDAIRKAGVLRVGVLANAPWLVENTSGTGEAWSGPAWLLANEYARRLNVKLEAVPVSGEIQIRDYHPRDELASTSGRGNSRDQVEEEPYAELA